MRMAASGGSKGEPVMRGPDPRIHQKGDQPEGRKYFLTLSPSVLNITRVPRCWRICLLVRLIMPWRFPAMADLTLPVPVILKRFLAPDFVLILGIWLSLPVQSQGARPCSPG